MNKTGTWRMCYDVESSVQNKISCGIDLYLPPFLFINGVVCNILVIVVMRSKNFRSNSTSFYIVVNALIDTASILVNLPSHYIFVNFHLVLQKVVTANSICSFFNVFGWGTSDLGILFTVAMTTDRAIAVRCPLHANKLCTTRRATCAVLGLSAFELIKLWHMFPESIIKSNSTSRFCDIRRNNGEVTFYVENVFPWIHIVILLASYVIAIAANVIILRSIRTSKNFSVRAGSKGANKHARSSSKNHQLSLMLVLDSMALVICTLPFAIVSVLMSQFNLLPDSQEGKNLAFASSFYLLYLNRCLNLPLYCVSGQRFRKALKSIICNYPSIGDLRCATKNRRLSKIDQSVSGHDQPSSQKSGSKDKDEICYDNSHIVKTVDQRCLTQSVVSAPVRDNPDSSISTSGQPNTSTEHQNLICYSLKDNSIIREAEKVKLSTIKLPTF
ncbi:alpha-1A adrenergic receptor-like [Biomphalaria glabrata]|uniref:Alpha-1A adrenergic receptor-like n=1 Tax=Biomphalaria glabrata TaxID=6526 RepID=A0A9U8DU10_BIOGL|nr:alpha-1A adrenergic receptor-like [Biomphalaria glabrata]